MNCTLCQDTGWISSRAKPDPERCSCVAAAEAARLVARALIPDRYARSDLRSFDVLRRGASSGDALLSVGRWVGAYPDTEHKGLLLTGPSGCGKTHLAIAAIKELMARQIPCLFRDYPSLLERIKEGYDGKGDNRAYNGALHAPVLVLDDLGAHRYTEWVEDTVAGIITHRLNYNLGLIATTSLPLASLKREREPSRPLVIETTLEDQIGAHAYNKLMQFCQVVKIV